MSLHLDPHLGLLLYANVPIQPEPPSTRLLRILPGPWAQLISCELHRISLKNPPPYKALSYSWNNGDAFSQPVVNSIHCNGVPVLVSANLFAALRRLRGLQLPVDIWVDSICVNQKNLTERSQQVGIMREIYSKSQEVVIWLAEPSEHDGLREELAPALTPTTPARIDWYGNERDRAKWEMFRARQKERQQSFNVHTRDIFGAICVFWLLSMGVKASHIIHLRHISQSAGIINGLHAILEQSWWRRTWVVQETVVTTNATVYYGSISAPWSMLADAAIAYQTNHLMTSAESVYPYLRPLHKFARTITDIEGTRQSWRHPHRLLTLLPLLRMFRSRQATDPRDKVFALLGLVQYWGGQAKIVPDYNMSADRVFWETTITLLKNTKSIDVLVGTLGRHENSTMSQTRPSWVPDWSCPPDTHENTRLHNARHYAASAGTNPTPVVVHGRSLLEMHATEFDEVAFIASELPLSEEGQSGRWRAVVAEWENSLRHLDMPNNYVGGGKVESAFWRTLCGDIDQSSNPGSGRRESSRTTEYRSSSYAEWRSVDTRRRRRTSIIAGYWQESGDPTDEDPATQGRNFFHHSVACASGWRRFFVTTKGYFGTVPRDTAAGDKIFIISGSRVPFILRETSHVSLCQSEPIDVLIDPQPGRISLDVQADRMQARKRLCSEAHTACYSVIGDSKIPGQDCWPSTEQWNKFNQTISGRLVQTTPPGAVCYPERDEYNETACEALLDEWGSLSYHSSHPSIPQGLLPAKDSCNPIHPNGTSVTGDPMAGERGCSLGSLPPYVVNATEPVHVSKAFRFAREHQLRLNVKNTGHGASQKNTAHGSLSIWTHNMKDVTFHKDFRPHLCNQTTNSTTRMAFTVGAGVQGADIQKASAEHNVIVVTGTNPDVGVVGWSVGGGHGFATGELGMGADNILEATVVTPNGDVLTVNSCQNEDLFWAIRGGGGSTFGVITSMTINAYPERRLTLWGFKVSAKNGTTEKEFWWTLAGFFGLMPEVHDLGLQGYCAINGPPSANRLTLGGLLIGWNKSNETMKDAVRALELLLVNANNTIDSTTNIIQLSSISDLVNAYPETSTGGTTRSEPASRLITRGAVRNRELFAKTLEIIGPKAVAPKNGLPNPSISGTLTSSWKPVDNALNPAWRDTVVHLISKQVWNDAFQDSAISSFEQVTYRNLQALRELDPTSGAYLNEVR
ncbi:FAD-linked oxidoreductase ZEB1 [Paramyrothecium foliicola]|nr:FAD-linked oxidoreductase ZEB1 [Paramyrothecium foliicola]